MAEGKYIERKALFKTVEDYISTHPVMRDSELFALFCSVPAADVPPALWTDEPIIGTEFMTHNQGQSGFEIHFRTDDKAKYEAVQDECRRQIDHAKPAADVRPVVRGRWEQKEVFEAKGHVDELQSAFCFVCQRYHTTPYSYYFTQYNFCPNCGAEMREAEDGT